MIKGFAKFQIGKGGLTQGVVESLQNAFKNRKTVRISMLKSAERSKVKETAEEICQKLKGNFTYKIVGFTIILKKHSSA